MKKFVQEKTKECKNDNWRNKKDRCTHRHDDEEFVGCFILFNFFLLHIHFIAVCNKKVKYMVKIGKMRNCLLTWHFRGDNILDIPAQHFFTNL